MILFHRLFPIVALFSAASFANPWTDAGTTISNTGNVSVSGTITGNAVQGGGVFSVAAYGAATSRTDNSVQFQNALNAAEVGPDGGTVLVPPGVYRFTSGIRIPAGVTLKGSWNAPHDGYNNVGSVLSVMTPGGPITATGFITMNNNSTFCGFTVVYPGLYKSVSGGTEYPYTIRGVFAPSLPGSGGTSVTIENVTIANCFRGIELSLPHTGHLIKNVNISTLTMGVYIDNNTDVGRIENLHIHNKFWWTAGNLTQSEQDLLKAQTMSTMVGMRFGRTDWEFVTGSFVIWANTGIWLDYFGTATPIPLPLANIMFTNGGVDESDIAVFVGRCIKTLGIGFNNYQFGAPMQISGNNEGPVKINNSNFINLIGKYPYLIAKYDVGTLMVSNTTFYNWPTLAIDANAGVTVINGGDFNKTVAGGTAVKSTNAGTYVSVTGSRLRVNGLTAASNGTITGSNNIAH